jgi:hypothetical protein
MEHAGVSKPAARSIGMERTVEDAGGSGGEQEVIERSTRGLKAHRGFLFLKIDCLPEAICLQDRVAAKYIYKR